jgi:hypothetical protein
MVNPSESQGSQDPGLKRIDVQNESELREWARKLDASPEQIKEAIAAVGDSASDVEEHLKGSRSTTNSERTREALRGDGQAG